MNDFASVCEGVFNDSHDHFTRAILALLQGAGSAKVGKDDFVGAFKTVCPAGNQAWLMWCLVYDTDASTWRVSELLTQPFGAIGGVYGWWRCAQAIKAIATRLFFMVLFIYVDDTFMVDVKENADQAKRMFRELVNLLGWELDAEKSAGMSRSIPLLGCRVAVSDDCVVWSLSEDKARSWSEDVAQALADNVLSPAMAAKMAGRFNFACCRAFGRVGRAYIRPLYWRQAASGGSWTLTRRLRLCLQWWAAALASSPGCQIRVQELQHSRFDAVMYTDADGAGGVGVVVIWGQDERREYAMGTVPRGWRHILRNRKTQINAYELLAITGAWNTWSTDFTGKHILCFVDTTSAMNIMISGWSRRPDLNTIAGSCWLAVSRAHALVEFAYVPSAANPADCLSRGQVGRWVAYRRRAIKWPKLGAGLA